MKPMKQWRCKNNHILGFIRWNGDDLPQLMILRMALNYQVDEPEQVDLLGPLSGSMPVRCSICDDVQQWAISVESLVALFMDLEDKTVFEFSQRLLKKSEKLVDPLPALPQMGKHHLGEEKEGA